jgi:hypothetical protein
MLSIGEGRESVEGPEEVGRALCALTGTERLEMRGSTAGSGSKGGCGGRCSSAVQPGASAVGKGAALGGKPR